MESATALCVAGTLRRATRSITRVYDRHLAAAGLTTTQLSLLRAIDGYEEPVALSELAEEQVFERSSLYRALEPLERDGLVAIHPGKGRAKCAALTAKGRRRIEQAMPLWRAAQEEFVSRFGRSAWRTLSARLIDIVGIARALPGE
jgi:DNA-binding MarR family transcriptional regulator